MASLPNQPLRVLFIAERLPPITGGLERMAEFAIRALRELGCELRVISPQQEIDPNLIEDIPTHQVC